MLRPILEGLALLKRYKILSIVQTLPATASATTKDFYSRSVMAVLKCKTCRDNQLVEYNVRGKPNPRLHFLPEPFAGLCDKAAQLFAVPAGAKRITLALDMGECCCQGHKTVVPACTLDTMAVSIVTAFTLCC